MLTGSSVAEVEKKRYINPRVTLAKAKMYKVSSEIYKETNFQTTKANGGDIDDMAVSLFNFVYPTESGKLDDDGDLIVDRSKNSKRDGVIEIEHSEATEIRLVGLQVWRGALLLADYIFHNSNEFYDKCLLELGAGVGLTSIAAAIFMRQVYCTDVDIGGILKLIQRNVERNRKLLKCKVNVLEYDFLKQPKEYATSLLKAIDESDIFIAADVIYDDELTNAFVRVIDTIFERENCSGRSKTIYVALEKRYVFTISELDSVAPMFEHFLKQTSNKPWIFEYIPINFPQYFQYERCAQLVLIKVTSRR